MSNSKNKALGKKMGKQYPAYGEKRDYPKRDIHVNGVYASSTNWARTGKEARQRFLEKHPEHAQAKIKIERGR